MLETNNNTTQYNQESTDDIKTLNFLVKRVPGLSSVSTAQDELLDTQMLQFDDYSES
jgi:hypothetical protein